MLHLAPNDGEEDISFSFFGVYICNALLHSTQLVNPLNAIFVLLIRHLGEHFLYHYTTFFNCFPGLWYILLADMIF